MAKRLILAGAGHAHLHSILNIPDFIRAGYSVTVVSAGDVHYYSGMGPGLLANLYTPEQTRFAVKIMAETRGAEFITGCISRIDADHNRIIIDDGRILDYDVLSCNLGSFVLPLISGTSAVIPVKPIENLYAAGRSLEHHLKTKALSALVVGGGPAGVEIAGNLRGLAERAGGRL
ncbi:MAG: pyridine nucleotide-disulfide oxidoreductase, partial [Syntrophus sp. (in: bacteria)]|nr:pyridine nucleotide-disulfide oxidoreductase [Syntrophus sp. (in: bacteria)]